MNLREELHDYKNILAILRKAKNAFNHRDVFMLRDLSNRTIHSASIYQDADSISIAVVLYALSKIIGRHDYVFYRDWKLFYKVVNFSFDKSILAIENDDLTSFREGIMNIRKAEHKLSGNLKKYIEEVFVEASINKASRLYEHGLSMEKTAEMLGITLFELAQYAGKTGIPDMSFNKTLPIEKRFHNTIKFFED